MPAFLSLKCVSLNFDIDPRAIAGDVDMMLTLS
jgi:hypothetical protein